MTFAPRFSGSAFIETTDNNGNKVYIVGSAILGLRAASQTTTILFTITGQQITIQENVDVAMEAIEPTPSGPPPPPVDITEGKLRMNPEGGALARELPDGHPKGDWEIFRLSDAGSYYTTNADNPEIAGWPFLKV